MRLLVLVTGIGMLVGCAGDNQTAGPAGPPGKDGTDGTAGTDGTDGMNGTNGTNGNNIIISDRAKHGLDISPVAVTTTGMTSDQIELVGQGSYLVNALANCVSCHGDVGGTPGFLGGTTAAGSFNARNLTPDATTGMKLTEAQFVDAMRNGTNFTCTGGTCTSAGNAMGVMPSNDYRWASLRDLRAIYAYLKAIPPVANAVTADTGTHGAIVAYTGVYTDGAVTRTLPAELDANNMPIPDPDAVRRGLAIQPLAAVSSQDATTEIRIGRGSYLINSFGRCYSCHSNPGRVSGKLNTTAWLTGGRVFTIAAGSQAATGTVRSMSTDLTGATHGFFMGEGGPAPDFLTFEGIITTGTHVDDADPPLLAAPMPWQHYRDLTLEDLAAVYTYLTQAAIAANFTGAADKLTRDASYYCAANGDCDQAGGETCDTDNTSPTFHECVGRACAADADCAVCQTCNGTTNTCGGPLLATCSSGL